MAKTSLGKVSVLPKGEYSSVIQYSRLDIVTYKGSSYLCIKDSLGIEITNEEYWQLLAQKGDTGPAGVVDTSNFYTKNEIEDLNNGLRTRVNNLENNKVDKKEGKQLSDENYTLAEKNKLAGLKNYDDTIIKDSIQAVRNDLANYYRKNETYSKEEVDQRISVIPKFAILAVDSLPTTEISSATIYLMKTGDETDNLYTEYIYINGKWEKLGTQKLDLSGYSTTEQMNQAISNAISTLEASMNTALAGKVDKIDGKGLSTEDYTTEEKTQLAANTTKITELTKKLDNYSDIFSLIERYCLLTRDGRVFGTHFEPFSVSHLSTGTRTKASVGKYMNPATNETPEDTNFPDFLTKPLFECNGHLDNDGEFHIDAIKGDENFSDTGKNDVWLAYRTVYLKHTYDEQAGEDYEISDCLFDGASVIKAAIRRDGSISPVIFIAKYQAGNIDGILYSSKGLKPARNQSYNNNVTNYHKKGRYYSGMTDYEYMFFQFLFVILFADRNNETHLRGNTNNSYQYNVAYGEENVSRVVLTTTQAANIDILSCVSVGNMGTATNKDRGQDYIHNIIDDVRVIGKEVVDENYTALILDCNPVDIPENALVSTMHEVSGFSDYVLGYTGSPVSCKNGKHGIVLAGCELLVGGYETIGNTFADIVDTDFTRDIYTTNDASKLTTTIATAKATYNKSSYQFHPVAAIWKYITAMIYDLVLGLSIYKSSGESGSGAATGYCDATKIDTGTSGQRELLRGGSLGLAGDAGLWCLTLDSTLGHAYWGSLSRPSVSALGVN